jgi:DNA-binding response OmpR family regulator
MNSHSSTVHQRFMPVCYECGMETSAPEHEPTRYEHAGIVMDRLKRRVTVDGRPIVLTAREFGLLELFLGQRGQVLTRERIAELIWETDAASLTTNLIDVYVLRLRKKLATADRPNPGIHTLRGIGYMLD